MSAREDVLAREAQDRMDAYRYLYLWIFIATVSATRLLHALP